MVVFFAVRVSRIKLKIDGSFGDIDVEFTIGAVVVLPASMFLLKVVVAKGLNRCFEGEFGSCRLGLSPTNLLECELRCGQVCRLVASEG